MARVVARLFSRFSLLRHFRKKKKPIRKAERREQPTLTLVPAKAPTVITRSGPSLIGDGLLRSFGAGANKTFALQGVSLELRANEMNLLMGPSGSGKTTLLAVLSALLRPCNGRVAALGQEIWRMGEPELERFRLKHCSYVFQGYNLFPALTAREQLEIVLRWGEGASQREARKRSEAVLSQLGLGNKLHMRPAQMSGGEKQRVAIGRALVKNPSFLFADEPTSALDWENGQQVIELLHGVARDRGATVLVVTHDPRLVNYADRVIEMADGRLMNDAPKDAVPLTVAGGHGQMMPHGPHIQGGFAAFHPARRPIPNGPRLVLQEPQPKGW
ncbi:MAG: ABC transporter ATP-binding protein [Fimbriiglobus sp.]|jgi:putative ABC transport system ATP-binding protein|nr:ABC transporter ATP-binding protein [Fimbriiglobus sp.]